MACIEIATLVCRYRQLEEEIEALIQQLTELMQTSVEYEWLKTVSGWGMRLLWNFYRESGVPLTIRIHANY